MKGGRDKEKRGTLIGRKLIFQSSGLCQWDVYKSQKTKKKKNKQARGKRSSFDPSICRGSGLYQDLKKPEEKGSQEGRWKEETKTPPKEKHPIQPEVCGPSLFVKNHERRRARRILKKIKRGRDPVMSSTLERGRTV